MSDALKVSPTPVQRNNHDVAMELTMLYYTNKNVGNIEEMQEVYQQFYATARVTSLMGCDELNGILNK